MKAKASVLTFICGAILNNAVLNKIWEMICFFFLLLFFISEINVWCNLCFFMMWSENGNFFGVTLVSYNKVYSVSFHIKEDWG